MAKAVRLGRKAICSHIYGPDLRPTEVNRILSIGAGSSVGTPFISLLGKDSQKFSVNVIALKAIRPSGMTSCESQALKGAFEECEQRSSNVHFTPCPKMSGIGLKLGAARGLLGFRSL